MPEARVVACPNCGKNVQWIPMNKWRPFCSERCKLIDIGAWASEQYRIRTNETPETSDSSGGESGDTR